MKIQNPHDKFFKETFSKVEVVQRAIIKGLSTEDIVKLTGLNEKEIKKIRKRMLS